jgi:hypothetical protein
MYGETHLTFFSTTFLALLFCIGYSTAVEMSNKILIVGLRGGKVQRQKFFSAFLITLEVMLVRSASRELNMEEMMNTTADE